MFTTPKVSLSDLLGQDYINALCSAAAYNGLMSRENALQLANRKVDLYPVKRQKADTEALADVGKTVAEGFDGFPGAATDAFAHALHKSMSPTSARGLTRIGEDGRLYFIGKSEHYHASLGHLFPGYKLLEYARALGVPNATHNNTRGYITRTLERELVRSVNGGVSDTELEELLASDAPKVLNRVVNLETGSLAVEAGVKMMLSRFYKLDGTFDEPKYADKTPVFLVMSDYSGGKEANYHGTTVLTQTFRGLWGGFYDKAEAAGLYKVVPVAINDIADFRAKIKQYNTGAYKTAGFMHEIILMNYGAIRLTPAYLKAAYGLCAQYDTPTMVDEIQSCMWYPGHFLFRLWGLKPDFAVVGKGFPGGEYPASRLITTAEMDTLNLFGALVTNGQEELASLAYLITMKFTDCNAEKIGKYGRYLHTQLKKLAADYPETVKEVTGEGHLCGLRFNTVQSAAAFAKYLNDGCVDISAQLYKAHCPPVVLLKPPVICGREAMDFLLGKLREALDNYGK